MNTTQFRSFPQRQAGAALVVSLVMLVILTLLGVAAMNGSVIELMMGTNTQLQTRVLANAERALATAETVTQGLEVKADYPETGIYNLQNDGEQNPQAMAWNGSDSAQDSSTGDRYMIEYTGTYSINGNSEAWGAKGTATTVEVFRVTARSEDAKGAVRMVQSIFVK
jgi:type IV pilus assembly protein PilX